MTKYMDTFVQQMTVAYQEDLPTTSNSIDSKNSLFSIFRVRKKSFGSVESMVEFYSAVALMENYDIKSCGIHKGTNAMMRAGIDLKEFEGEDFFEAIKLREILLKKNTENDDFSKEDVSRILETVSIQ